MRPPTTIRMRRTTPTAMPTIAPTPIPLEDDEDTVSDPDDDVPVWMGALDTAVPVPKLVTAESLLSSSDADVPVTTTGPRELASVLPSSER